MSESHIPVTADLAPMIGIRIQELRSSGLLSDSQPLLRIDNTQEARRAPFQLDVATGKVHRAGCAVIAEGSSSALYAVWQLSPEAHAITCKRCKPMPDKDSKPEKSELPTDLLYGAIAIASQFGGVLRERGKEYRNSLAGQLIGWQVEQIYSKFNEQERNILGTVLNVLDELASVIHSIDSEVARKNDGPAAEDAPKAESDAAAPNAAYKNGNGDGRMHNQGDSETQARD